MYHASCKDLGDKTCEFEASGATSEEVKNKMWDHVKTDHKAMFDNMSGEDRKGLTEKIEKHTHER